MNQRTPRMDAHREAAPHASRHSGMGAARARSAELHGNAPTVAQYFDTLATTWENELEPCGAVHAMTALLAGTESGSKVLDIGCGTGIMTQAYLDAGAAETLGLDVSPEMIRIARDKFASESHVHFACADICAFGEPGFPCEMMRPATFDVFCAYNVYPHIMDKQALVRKAAALLAPRGRFLVAHGASREHINAHHVCVPASICTHLDAAAEAARAWAELFDIDTVIDTDRYYAFGGTLRA